MDSGRKDWDGIGKKVRFNDGIQNNRWPHLWGSPIFVLEIKFRELQDLCL